MSTGRWRHGEVVRRRELLGLQPDGVAVPPPVQGCWIDIPVHVVADDDRQLVTYVATGARFEFPDGAWPTPTGRHPWYGRPGWHGHGCLMLHRPGEHHSVWHFWEGPDRTFRYWYLNLQTAFVRTATGFDTQDLELDLVVHPDGSHDVKDDDVLEERVAEGRYSPELIRWTRAYGQRLIGRLEAEGPWWDTRWVDWTPPPHWPSPDRPAAPPASPDLSPTGRRPRG